MWHCFIEGSEGCYFQLRQHVSNIRREGDVSGYLLSNMGCERDFDCRAVYCGASHNPDSPGKPQETYPHIPVLLEEVLGFFAGQHIKTFVDGTLGAGA